jgi:LETM1 and EF-hand domain-containing protein 1, mitochondrial
VREGGTPLKRAEARFIRLYKQDALKLVPFVMIALVLEEIIPLLVLYAPFMLPSTCVLPSQAERIQRKHREGQLTFSVLRDHFDQIRAHGTETGTVALFKVDGVSLQALSGILGLSTFGPPPIRRWRIAKALRYLAADDAQLRAENMGGLLTDEELAQALHERGMYVPEPYFLRGIN